MAKYRYAGPNPIEILELPDEGGESRDLIRPGDVREFEEEPLYGPWELLDEPETDGGGAEPPGPLGASPAAPGAAPAPELAPAELGELKKEADAGLTAPSLTAPPAKEF